MERLYTTYKLKPGAKMEDFRKFSKEIDQPLILSFEGVHGFDVYEITGADPGTPDFQIVEEIMATDTVEEHFPHWQKYGDIDTIKTLIGKKIE